MSGFRYYNVMIRGLAPGLLMSNGQMADPENFYYQRAKELSNKTAAGEEVERQRIRYHITGRLYVSSDKQIVIPSEMVSSTLRKGASAISVKNGRKWWSGLTIMEDAPLIVDELPAWDKLYEDDRFVHRCMARDAKGGQQPRYRPFFKKWSIIVSVEIDTGNLDVATLKAIFSSAGRVAGFGDWRPGSPRNPGKYGRFEVLNAHEAPADLSSAA